MLTTTAPRKLWLASAAFLVSGAAGLGSQIVWSKMFALGLGHEMPATLAVVAAFMGGLAFGAWALDHVISRSARPGLWYAALEGVIGLWSVALAFGVPWANRLALALIGLEPPPWRHWSVALAVPFLTLLPATAAMGATLPAVERFTAPLRTHGRWVGALYGANTLGAALGALAGAFVLMPALGFRNTGLVFAGLNLFCGIIALALARGESKPVSKRKSDRSPAALKVPNSTDEPHFGSRLTLTLFLTGLLGIGFEVLGIRMLAQVLENTIYTFVSVLAVYLTGTAAGAAVYQRFLRSQPARSLLATLLCLLAAACLLGTLALPWTGRWYAWCRQSFGDGPTAVALAEMLAASAVFLLPTLLMGAVFSHLVQNTKRGESGVGRAVALNTLGGALAPFLFGILLLPAWGAKWALILIAVAYLLLIPEWPWQRWWLLATSVGLLIVVATVDIRPAHTSDRGRLIAYREGVMATVAVTEDTAQNRTLRVNHRFQMGGTATTSAERRHAQIPLLLHPQPRRALFLGLGTGITFGAAASHPKLEADGVELLPEVIETMPHFSPENADPLRHPRLRPFVADARRFIRATDRNYDVIVSDLFHPAMDGAGALYTREHFLAIRQRLAPGGLFCQWLPLYQLDDAMLRVITRTFLDVFPEAQGWLLRFNLDTPVIGLIGFLDRPQWTSDAVERHLADVELARTLRQLVLSDSVQLFGCLLADAKSLREFSHDAPLNTDNLPRVIFEAPRASYRKDLQPGELLFTLLKNWQVDPGGVLTGPDEFIRRVRQFTAARDLYLQGLAAEAGPRVTEAVDLYLASARASADFTWSYARCLTIAQLYAQTDRPRARALLERLIEAQPAQAKARELLSTLPAE